MVQHGLQKLFKDEFENFMGKFPSSNHEKAKKKKGKAVGEILQGYVLCFRLTDSERRRFCGFCDGRASVGCT